jgi:plastocyanin
MRSQMKWRLAVPALVPLPMLFALPVLLGLSVFVALPNAAAAYETSEVANGGSISGWIRFGDEYPQPEFVKVERDLEACGTRYEKEEFVVDPESKGLQHVVVFLEGVAAGKTFPADAAVTIDQKGCRYEPHVQVGFAAGNAAGADLVILNSDEVFHTVHAFSSDEQTVFNLPSMAATELTNNIGDPGFYHIVCDVHPWMSAWVAILDHPYGTVSDETGSFSLENVPPGDCTLRVWHEGLGEMERPVTVAAGKDTAAEFPLGAN